MKWCAAVGSIASSKSIRASAQEDLPVRTSPAPLWAQPRQAGSAQPHTTKLLQAMRVTSYQLQQERGCLREISRLRLTGLLPLNFT